MCLRAELPHRAAFLCQSSPAGQERHSGELSADWMLRVIKGIDGIQVSCLQTGPSLRKGRNGVQVSLQVGCFLTKVNGAVASAVWACCAECCLFGLACCIKEAGQLSSRSRKRRVSVCGCLSGVQCQRQQTIWRSTAHARAGCQCWLAGLGYCCQVFPCNEHVELHMAPPFMQEFLPIGHLNHLEAENFKTMMTELKGSIDKGVAFANKA